VPEEQQPGWVKNAQARPYMESSRDMLLSLLPEDPSDLIDRLPGSLRNFGRPDPGSGTPEVGDAPGGDGGADAVEPDPSGGADAVEPNPTGGALPPGSPAGGVGERDAGLAPALGAARAG
jgi:hypothetical protein